MRSSFRRFTTREGTILSVKSFFYAPLPSITAQNNPNLMGSRDIPRHETKDIESQTTSIIHAIHLGEPMLSQRLSLPTTDALLRIILTTQPSYTQSSSLMAHSVAKFVQRVRKDFDRTMTHLFDFLRRSLKISQLYNLLRKQGLFQPNHSRQRRAAGYGDARPVSHRDASPDHRSLEQLARLKTPRIGSLGLGAARPVQVRLRPAARCGHERLVNRGKDGARTQVDESRHFVRLFVEEYISRGCHGV